MHRFNFDDNGRPVARVELRLPPARRQIKLQEGVALGRETGFALIDTGADVSAFDQEAASRAGITTTGPIDLRRHAEVGCYRVPGYDGELIVEGFGPLTVTGASGLRLAQYGWIAILGRDFLRNVVLVVNGPGNSVTLLPRGATHGLGSVS